MSINPLDAEMIRHSLMSIPNHIETNITRTAYSPLIYEFKDYAVGIVDPEGRLIAQAVSGIPLFLANALGIAVADGIAVHGREGIRPGDVFISNHTGTIGQHLNNVAMYAPIFSGSDLVGFMAVIAHWLDIGGQEVGSCAVTGTTEVFQEGLHFRSIRLWSEGRPCRDIYSIIELNTRFPGMLLGDIEAQLAGCLMGRDMVCRTVERYTLASVREAIELMWRRTEARARAAVLAIPDGTYRASSILDNDGLDLHKPVKVDVTVIVKGDEMTVDFSEVADQVRGSINSGRFGGAMTAARIAFKFLAAPDEPANEGSFRPLKVIIPDGKFMSARPTAAMAMYSSALPTVVDTVLKAMTDVVPDRVPAGHHASFGILITAGVDPRNDESFVNITGSTGGWGACSDMDGSGPYRTMVHGDTYDIPAEVQEALYPVRFGFQRIAVDSGGAGRFKGCWGVERQIELLADTGVQVNFERHGCPPWGLQGGHEAMGPAVRVTTPDSQERPVTKGSLRLNRGDRIYWRTSGGGGFGNPADRPPERVREDVRQGYTSAGVAASLYGITVADED